MIDKEIEEQWIADAMLLGGEFRQLITLGGWAVVMPDVPVERRRWSYDESSKAEAARKYLQDICGFDFDAQGRMIGRNNIKVDE